MSAADGAGSLPIEHQQGAVFATIFGSFLVRLAGAATGVMLGIFLARLHRSGTAETSAMALGLLMGAFYLSELVGAPICGFLVDRKGVRLFLLAGPILGVLAEFLFAGRFHLSGLLTARLLQGLTTALTIPAALAFLSELTEAESTRASAAGRGVIMGWFEVGSIGGLAAGNIVGGFLWEGLRQDGFLPLAVLYGVAALLFVVINPATRPRKNHSLAASLAGLREAIDLVPCWLAVNAAAGLWFGHAAYQLSGANPRPHQQLTVGFSGAMIGIIFGVYTLLFAFGTIGWGSVLGRFPVGRAMRVGALGLLFAMVSLLGINHAPSFRSESFWLFVLLGILALAAETAFTPAALTMLASRSDGSRGGRGAVMGVYSTLLGGGQLLGVLIGGLVASYQGVDGMIAATLVLAVIGLVTIPRDRAEEVKDWGLGVGG
ncbi:MAG TPA: MFS transporter [Chloroflexota bacterium]|nr:MFS transporter [Chloroflexota bacterium]